MVFMSNPDEMKYSYERLTFSEILQSMMIVMMMIMLWMMKTMMMMTTLPRTLCGHLPNKAAVEVR